MSDFGQDGIEASHILGQCARFDIATAFNPAYAVACRPLVGHFHLSNELS
jgi:hypothetical protein